MNNEFGKKGRTGMKDIKEQEVRKQYERLVKLLIEKKLSVTTMESATAGQIASLLTDTEGASAIIKGAFVTYSNEAKIQQGVPAKLIEQFGVYSEETAGFMAICCQRAYKATIGIGVTGTFGNVDPANADSAIGQVYFAIAYKEQIYSYHKELPEQASRYDYKMETAGYVADALFELLEYNEKCWSIKGMKSNE